MSVDAKELYHVLHAGGANVLLDLVVDGKARLALARDVQRDHIHNRFIHVDFLAVSRTEKITIAIPVQVVGESVGVKAGGVLEHHLWEIEAECLPGDVPDAIRADVTELAVGDSLKVADLVAPKGVTFLPLEDELVLAVVPPQAREVEEVAAEIAEGEIEAEGEEVAEAGHARGGRRGRVARRRRHDLARRRAREPRGALRAHPSQPRPDGRRRAGASRR